jgi:hypothetical protein
MCQILVEITISKRGFWGGNGVYTEGSLFRCEKGTPQYKALIFEKKSVLDS